MASLFRAVSSTIGLSPRPQSAVLADTTARLQQSIQEAQQPVMTPTKEEPAGRSRSRSTSNADPNGKSKRGQGSNNNNNKQLSMVKLDERLVVLEAEVAAMPGRIARAVEIAMAEKLPGMVGDIRAEGGLLPPSQAVPPAFQENSLAILKAELQEIAIKEASDLHERLDGQLAELAADLRALKARTAETGAIPPFDPAATYAQVATPDELKADLEKLKTSVETFKKDNWPALLVVRKNLDRQETTASRNAVVICGLIQEENENVQKLKERIAGLFPEWIDEFHTNPRRFGISRNGGPKQIVFDLTDKGCQLLKWNEIQERLPDGVWARPWRTLEQRRVWTALFNAGLAGKKEENWDYFQIRGFRMRGVRNGLVVARKVCIERNGMLVVSPSDSKIADFEKHFPGIQPLRAAPPLVSA